MTKPSEIALPETGTLGRARPVHLAGVAGSAMSGLAALLAQRGFAVTGTDPAPDAATAGRLAAAGIEVRREQDGRSIPADAQLVVASAALPPDHPELVAARSRGVPVVKYAALLGALFNASDGIAVAGTHGKTTTAAMIVSALRAAGVSPGFVIGAHVPQLGAGADAGASDVFVAEACEYNRSFLNLRPRRAVITNVDDDHLDVYGDLAGVARGFAEFASKVAPGGAIAACADWPLAVAAAEGSPGRPITYSARREDAAWTARSVRFDGGVTRFEVRVDGAPRLEMELRVPGLHNVANALAALAVTADVGLPVDDLAAGIGAFRGAARRFQEIGEARGVTVVDDYAHHPTEIRALLEGARDRFPGRRRVAVFQPHQIARTRLLFAELAAAFGGADLVLLADIYAARDGGASPEDLSSAALADAMRARGTSVLHVRTLDDAAAAALGLVAAGDVLITVGAGDVHRVGPAVLAGLARP